MLRRRNASERGAVAVLTAILSICLFLMAAFVIDIGQARDTRRQAQNAADASALAGANALFPSSSLCTTPSGSAPPCITDAIGAVKLFATNNYNVTAAEWTSCTDPQKPAGYVTVSGQTPCISFDSTTAPTKVRVNVPTRTITSGIGKLTGVPTIAVKSAAETNVSAGAKCALCFLGNVDTNNTDFTVSGGSIAVKGSIDAGPNSNWQATAISVTGTVSGGTFTPPYTTVASVTDPFSSMTLPIPTSSYTSTASHSDPCTEGPGVYGDVTLPNSACQLSPGIYVITGAWAAKNNTVLTNKPGGVTLYLKPTGSLDLKNGSMTLTPALTGATSGFVLLADRTNTNALTLQGNGSTELTGKVYAAGAQLSFNGNSCFGFSGGPIVVAGAGSVGNHSCVTVLNAADATVAPGVLNLSK